MTIGKKIIVVDDLQHLREAIVFELDMVGFDVREAENGEHALEILKEFPCDLIVSDVRMPKCTGPELLISVRKLYGPSPAFMFISAFSDLSKEKVFAMGANGFIAKPFELEEFMRRVTRLCEPISVRLGNSLPIPTTTGIVSGEFENLSTENNPDSVGIGNGGIFVPAFDSTLKDNQIVEIDLRFRTGEMQNLKCQGQIQWQRQGVDGLKVAGVGIELFGLTGHEYQTFISLTKNINRFLPLGIETLKLAG